MIHPDEDISLEERRAQLPKYQRNLPRPGQAPIGNPPVGPIGGMMPPQPGIPQQQGMRPPMPPHGILLFYVFLFSIHEKQIYMQNTLHLKVRCTD